MGDLVGVLQITRSDIIYMGDLFCWATHFVSAEIYARRLKAFDGRLIHSGGRLTSMLKSTRSELIALTSGRNFTW